MQMFFPLFPAKDEDVFKKTSNIKQYLKAESEWKKAVEESDEFEESILKVKVMGINLVYDICSL